MQTSNNKNQHLPDKIVEEEQGDNEIKRDLELENIGGNLMIAQYQVDKLRYKLTQIVGCSRYRTFSSSSKKTSAHTFKHDGKWYKVSIKVEAIQP